MNNIFQGLITALITPFKNNKIDYDALKKLIVFQIDNHTDAIIVGGSTGEGLSLSLNEYEELITQSLLFANGKIPIIGVCNSSNTNFAIEVAKLNQKLQVQGLMVTIPPYVKPTQTGIFEHFKAIHNAINLPIMIYAIPSRTGVDIDDETLSSLAMLPNIVALKDSSANLTRPLKISANIKENFNILAGDDILAIAYNSHGAKGCVSVISNILPKHCKSIQTYWQQGKVTEALKQHQALLPFYHSVFLETNPIGIKYAASKLNLCANELRLPLTKCTEATATKINNAIDILND